MRIEIEIPKEFEKHFNEDKFKDSFERIMADIKHSLENGDCLCAGRYEFETIEMLENAFKNSKTAYDVDKVVEELEKSSKWVNETNEYGDDDGNNYISLSKAIEIVKHGDVSDDACEWKLTDTRKLMPYKTSCGNEDLYDSHYKYCPYCGKKIKVVE